MSYTFLSPPLHPVANQAMGYLAGSWGISKSRFSIEGKIDPNVTYCPTLSAPTTDHHILCVDVSDKAYNASLDDFVLQCMKHHLPVKLFVAIPKNAVDPDYRANLKKLSDRGVGLIEVDQGSSHVVRQPLSLSLMTAAPIHLARYPAKYRQELQRAEQMFRDGNPVEACAAVLSLIEGRTRALAKCATKKSWWKGATPSGNFDKDAWANVLKCIGANLDTAKAGCAQLTDIFMAQLIGVTPHRNEVSHPPKNLVARVKRDERLRTRFEHSCNLLHDFVEVTKSAKL